MLVRKSDKISAWWRPPFTTIWEERQFIFLLYLHSHLQETKEFLFSLWSGRWNELFFDSLMTQRESYTTSTSFCCWWGLDCSALVNNLKNHLTPRHTKLKLIATLSKKVQQFNHRHTRYMPAQLCWENCSANLMIFGEPSLPIIFLLYSPQRSGNLWLQFQ